MSTDKAGRRRSHTYTGPLDKLSQSETAAETGLDDSFPEFAGQWKKIYEVIGALNEMVHGFDFAKLLTVYYRSYITGDDEGKAKVVKWFRGSTPPRLRQGQWV